jgi:hypothetical protein
MKLFSRVRKPGVFATLILALALSGAFLPSRGASSPSVQPRYSWQITYYNDAAHTQEIGSRYVNCNGQGTLTGQSSSYSTSEIVDICCRDPGNNGWVPC